MTDCIMKFWKIEETQIAFPQLLDPEQEFCESHYQKSHKRDKSGRYIVEMPIRE